MKKTFLLYSLGCRTNQAEIASIAKDLGQYGFVPSEKNPDVILINTCVVTAKAERETRKTIRHFRRLYPQAFLVILGCGVDAQDKFKIDLPDADLFVENRQKEKTAELIAQHFHLSKTKPAIFADRYFLSGRVFLKIQEGCDQFCAYCIVPFLRGKPKSLSPEKIISQINKLEKRGIKEIILTGTNLALYGEDCQPPLTLTVLLEKILKETKAERITLSSIEPDVVDKKFVNLFLKNKRLSPFFHLALQSGSVSVLRRMRRKTDLEKLFDLLVFLKKRAPEFVFRADLLVGFPKETEEEFGETVNFVKRLKISFAHIFPFSKRKGTLAWRKIQEGEWQEVPSLVKKERARLLKGIVGKIRLQEGKKLLGKVLPCLFLQKEGGFWRTIASNSWPVKVFSEAENLRGKIREIKIDRVGKNCLIGSF